MRGVCRAGPLRPIPFSSRSASKRTLSAPFDAAVSVDLSETRMMRKERNASELTFSSLFSRSFSRAESRDTGP